MGKELYTDPATHYRDALRTAIDRLFNESLNTEFTGNEGVAQLLTRMRDMLVDLLCDTTDDYMRSVQAEISAAAVKFQQYAGLGG